MYLGYRIDASATAVSSAGDEREAVAVLCDPRIDGFEAGGGNPVHKG